MFSILTHNSRTPSQPQHKLYWQERIIRRNLTYFHWEAAKRKIFLSRTKLALFELASSSGIVDGHQGVVQELTGYFIETIIF